MPKQDPDFKIYQHTKKIFGDNDRFLLMAVSGKGGSLWDYHTLSRIDLLIQEFEEYQEPDPVRELVRQHRLRELASAASMTGADLAASFVDDPVFLRFLRRDCADCFEDLNRVIERSRFLELADKAERLFELKKAEVVDTILSPLTVDDISGTEDALIAEPLIPEDENGKRIIPKTREQIADFKRRLEKNPAFRQGIYAVDKKTGRITDFAVLIKFTDSSIREKVVAEFLRITRSYPDLNIIVSGVPFVNHSFNEYMKADLARGIPLVVFVMTLVFYYSFRSVRGVVLPLFTLCMSVIWTMGLMGLLGYPVTAVGITLPPLLISVGSSYAIHVLNQYYSELSIVNPKNPGPGVSAAMGHVSLTVFLAGLTTFAAFATLLTNEVSAIREWGCFSALGVAFSVFISVTMIPAFLVLLPPKYPKGLSSGNGGRRITLVDQTIVHISKWATRYYKRVFAVTLCVLAISIVGMLRLRVDTEFLHYFKEDDPTRVSVEVAGDKFGGGWGFDIIIDSNKPDGVKSPEFLKSIDKLRDWLVADENPDLNVGRTDAFSDFIKRMHMAMNADDLAYYKIPDSREDILDYLEIFSGEDSNSDGRPDAFEPFVDVNYQKANILVRLTHKTGKRVGTTEIQNIIEKIKRHLDATIGKSYKCTITGFPVINVKLSYYVIMGQLWGLALSLGFVFFVVLALYRRILAGPLALIDMGVTILINFGVMGWLGIDLDTVTSIIATITIGIGIDDTIHFLNTYRFYQRKKQGINDAIASTMRVSGKAILFTSLALTLGFLSQLSSHFLPIILFSALIAFTMVLTTIGSILLVPAAIRMTRFRLSGGPRKKAKRN